LNRNTAKIDINSYSFAKTCNVFEPVAKISYPSVANTLAWLVEYAPSRMTGTGACCFSLLDDEQQAKELAKQSPNFVDCYVTKTTNLSSCHKYIAKHFTTSAISI
jgi:4-diphosphocytidyl-2-C-methyl-D-erythritol kinase